jgi:hypothetical protein
VFLGILGVSAVSVATSSTHRLDTSILARQEPGPMAFLNQKESHEAVALLADEMGLQRLRDKLVRLNGFVTRRPVHSASTLADQLYMLSSGLRRQTPATLAFHGVWGEVMNDKIGKEGEEKLEELAKAVNECLGEGDAIIADKHADLERALGAYAEALKEKVGERLAYLDMLLKAVPDVAKMLREGGLPQKQSS